jgi:hypothetical protein
MTRRDFIASASLVVVALDVARVNWKLRDTPRSRRLLAKALRISHHAQLST